MAKRVCGGTGGGLALKVPKNKAMRAPSRSEIVMAMSYINAIVTSSVSTKN
jgi:hypothetical protein